VTRKFHSLGGIPLDEEFARALIVIPDENFSTCPECRTVHRRGTFPRVVEWPVYRYDKGSDKVGDFTWHGRPSEEMLVTERVRRILSEFSDVVEFHEIGMWQDPKLKRPKRITKRTKPRIWLPYEGPPLWELEVHAWCRLDWTRTGLFVKSTCPTCGDTVFQFPDEGELVIDAESWNGEHIFRVHEYQSVFFSQEVIEKLIAADATNFAVWRSATIPDD
jgi:hypothetical protein